MSRFDLRPYQQQFVDTTLEKFRDRSKLLGVMPTGCHAPGHPILLADGSSKVVQMVQVGDQLMGPDFRPRTVLALHGGVEEMYRIVPSTEAPFVVNKGHILHLLSTASGRNPETVDLPVSAFAALSRLEIQHYKLTGFCGNNRRFVGHHAFSIEEAGIGEYFGFTLDGDHLYLDGNFIVHHNSGKTVCFSETAKRIHPVRTLILAHREELLTQAQDKLFRSTGLAAQIEKAEHRASHQADVVVASVQTLMRDKRLQRWPRDHFGLVVVDEAHHVLADSYQKVLSHFDPYAKVLGVTATPDRGDKRNLGEYFDDVSFEIGLHELIKQRYLSPISVRTVPIQINLTGVRTTAGDYNDADLGNAIEPFLESIVGELGAAIGNRKTLVFLPLVRTSKLFVDLCRRAGLTAEHIDGTSSDRKEILDAYGRGEFQILCNSMLLTEGFDEPSVSCVICLRPTKIRALYCLDEQTEVLTPSGWRRDVEVGDVVAAFDPKTGQIRFVPSLAKVRRPLESGEHFVSYRGPSADVRVTNKHRMLYDNRRRAGWKFCTAEQLAGLRDGASIPVSGRCNFRGAPLSDDEIQFIGWAMSDGCINRCNNTIQISQAEHQPWLDSIRSSISGSGLKFGEHRCWRTTRFNQTSRNVVFTVSRGKPRGRDRHLSGWAHLGPWISKDFSEELLWSMDERQFEILLNTLHLADGNKHQPEHWTPRSFHISKGNRTFIDRLQIACILRGYRANISEQTAGRQNPLYTLHIKKTDRSCLGSQHDGRPQWQTEEHKQEQCWCVENELGTLVTRRNGKVAIVGNCQIIGRGTRIHPGKENLLVLDFLWMTEKHSLVRPAHLVAPSEEIAQQVIAMSEDAAGEDLEQDLMEMVSDAKEARERKLAEELEANAKRKSKLIDPIEFALSLHEVDLADWEPTMKWHRDPPSDGQLRALSQFGFDPAAVPSKGYASVILDRIFSRRELNLATPKQLHWLRRTGHPQPELATFAEASAWLNQQFNRRAG